MATEIEAKFLRIHPDDMTRRLQDAGFTCTVPRRLMTRVTLHMPPEKRKPGEWWRVRNEGNGVITMTWKCNDAFTIDGTREFETTVGDFDQTVEILKTTGLVISAYQETYRTTWERGAVMATIDEWPGLDPVLEIEGPGVDDVTAAAADLDLDMACAVYGGVAEVYQMELGHAPQDVNNWPEITFQNPPRRAASSCG